MQNVAKEMGKSEFWASNEWLQSFRKMHQMLFNEVGSEADDVYGETIAE
jgi:hypothetical protein